MDEGSGEHSPKVQDDMEVGDNPEVQMSESTDQSLTPGNGPKAVFATGAAKKSKKKNKKNKTPTKDLPTEEVIAEEYEEDSDGALTPDEPKEELVDGHVITEGARKLIDVALTTPIPTAAELTSEELDDRAQALDARRQQLLDEAKNIEEEKKHMAAKDY